MNEDFTDTINKFKEVLASKNIDFSKILNNAENKESEDNSSDSDSNFNFDFDIETIIKLKNILSSTKKQNSPKLKLLMDLKPFLSPNAQNSLDELIKFVKILTLLEVFKDNGFRKLN